MRLARLLSALLIGEALLLYGLWLAWEPLALVIAGCQLVAAALLTEAGDGK
jgi:hypothetical protein